MFTALLLVLIFVYIGMDSVVEDISLFVRCIKERKNKKKDK